jgi:hypothetical protein
LRTGKEKERNRGQEKRKIGIKDRRGGGKE